MSLTDRLVPLCDLLLGAAYADEEFKDRERDEVKSLLVELSGSALSADIEAQIAGFDPKLHDVATSADAFADDSEDNRKRVLHLVAAIHEADEELNPLRLQPNLTTPHTRVVVAQLIVSLAAIAGGAQLFVREITVLSPLVGITPLVLSLIIAPLATELPEKFNSVLWVRQRKDTLAMGNISGAMVFQSCIPVAVGLWYTPWVLDQAAIASAAIAVGAGLLLQVLLRPGNVLSGGQLAFFGLFYAAFIVYIVGFYQGPIPVPH